MMDAAFHRGRHPREYVAGHGEARSPEEFPYSYSPYFIRGSSKEAAGASSFYSDRLQLWYTDEQRAAARKASGFSHWKRDSSRTASAYLTALMSKPVRVVAIAEGCNVSNGYPYWIVWTREEAKP